MTTIESINLIVNILIKISILVLVSILVYKLYKYFTTTYSSIKNKQVENEKVKLYSTIDPKLVREELNALIREYTARYMTKNIMVNQINFIKNDQMDEMVREITKEVILEMSDLYLTYCKLIYNISNEDELLEVVYKLVVDVVLDMVTKFNDTVQ